MRSAIQVSLAVLASVALAVTQAYGQPSQVSYQGQLDKDGAAFSGTAAMKFAIVSGTTTLWSNDGTSTSGGEPTGSVNVPVGGGVFTVQLGAPPMVALTSVLLGPSTDAVLRLWVDTGSGFEQLSDQPFASAPFSLQSGWTLIGGNVYRSSGHVGIGTSSPQSDLHMSGGTESVGLLLEADTQNTDETAHPTITFLQDGGLIHGRVGFVVTPSQSNVFELSAWSDVSGDTTRLRLATVGGAVSVGILKITGGSDLAEPFLASAGEVLQEGSLVVIDDEDPGKLTLSNRPYDPRLAGIVSGAGGVKPGLTLSQESVTDEGQHVALAGRVYALATAENGAIRPGDLLTASSTPGYAMKATDRERSYGAVVGKAMSALKEGKGLVLVLVQPR